MRHIKTVTALMAIIGFTTPTFCSEAQAKSYKADNTIQNRNENQNVTAEDQSNRKSDVKLTAKLRRAIVRQHDLSMDAKNVKIISDHGCVILRGPVKNNQEKDVIDNLAKECCGSNYRNELQPESTN